LTRVLIIIVFPEMRAQLRTYHAIPSLQAHQDPNSYKQLQDAPRLKSILKGASEDRAEPNSIDRIKELDVPRTNPVNLIFVMAQFAPKMTDLHFPPPREFFDLLMHEPLSSESRARAFLWLMWFYLESDFTEEGAAENPFGSGVDYGVNLRNQGVPKFVYMEQEEMDKENVDTPEEREYGEIKMKERKRIIEADQAALAAEYGPPKRGPKPKLNLPPEDGASPANLLGRMRPSIYESDMDSTRSTPPPRAPNIRIQSVLNGPKGRASSIKHDIGSSPAPSGFNVIMPVDGSARRPRPLTAHQLAVEHNRSQRVNYLLSRGLRKKHHQAKKLRRQEGAVFRAQQRSKQLVNPFEDSEDEENISKPNGLFRTRGFGGLMQLNSEEDDFGEEVASYAASVRRMGRRLDRWDSHKGISLGVMGTNRVAAPMNGRDADETEDEKPTGEGDEGDLDDMDEEILGLGVEDEDLDDVDKEILGLGDETESEEE
jgi:Ino eighty subunit 1